jgi:hypothetical protein
MPDFKQSYPKHKAFKCDYYWHLKKSGLQQAIYCLIDNVTLSGKNEFFGSLEGVAAYFGTSYSVVHRAVKQLVRTGFLTYDTKNRHYWYVSHTDWAKKHPGQCCVRELAAWQEETDPFVGQIYAICGGNIRVFPRQVEWFRKLACDQEFLEQLRIEVANGKARRAAGDYNRTSAKQCLWATADFFKERKTNRVETGTLR